MNKLVAVDFFGSAVGVAKALGISRQAVTNWPELIPKGAALELEKITNGELKCVLSLYKGRRRKNKRSQSAEV